MAQSSPAIALLVALLLSCSYASSESTAAAAAATVSSSSASAASTPATNFIAASCRATTYPAVCVQSLRRYAPAIQKNPRQLVMAAMSVSLEKARSAKVFVFGLARSPGLKPRDHAAIRDCLEEANDSLDRLSRSIRELKSMDRARGPEFVWHMSNAQTWVSAAITDYTTCMDGFSGRALSGTIKSSVQARMNEVVKVTSNALALCNRLGGK